MARLLFSLLIAVSLGTALRGTAAEPELDLKAPGWQMVRLRNGVNGPDLNADGKADVVVVARRENYNAHGFEATAIYIWATASEGEKEKLHLVPVEAVRGEEEKEEQRLLLTAGGADGLLHDFRLYTNAAQHTAVLIQAERAYGANFADSQPVEFRYFQLTRNKEELAGDPTLRFVFQKKTKSAKSYQDVNDAFLAELGIGSDGRLE